MRTKRVQVGGLTRTSIMGPILHLLQTADSAKTTILPVCPKPI